ncbi:MAG: Fe-S cluster assembly protein SufD [Deltaproteobacteria bacterium CG11_big_fil_rev_8_21_14_0_20_47_16]|nr:MAG: Fe-S cluster assembly protein SufD [Deltaproteobacteria bacterium CG11_big_fil_rev_8_21_14_0_20_47_16]
MTTIADISKDNVSKTAQTVGDPAWLKANRDAAWERYSATPYPTRKEELWKYTDLSRINWGKYAVGTTENVVLSTLEKDAAARGAIFCTLADALKKHPELVQKYLGRNTDTVNGKYAFENLAFTDRGFFCFVPKGVKITTPLHVETQSTQDGATLFPRTIVVLEEGAEATVFDQFTSPNAKDGVIGYTNARVELYVGQSARLHYLQMQNWHNGMLHLLEQHAELERDAYLSATTISLGGHISKSTIAAILKAPGAVSYLFGLGYGNDKQQFDHHTMQTHLAPNTTSDLLYKMAMNDRARSTYTGIITMTPDAQKADAYQSNKNLLLSKTARANTVPQLEILANDVRCTHGASVGTVEDEQLYYLESRGLSREVARDMIVHGFFEDLIGKLPEETLKNAVRKAVNDKLGTTIELEDIAL